MSPGTAPREAWRGQGRGASTLGAKSGLSAYGTFTPSELRLALESSVPIEQTIPIIQIRSCLLVSIQTELHDRLALELQESIMERVRLTDAKGVILDVSAVEVIDSYITRILNDIGKSVRFMGAVCYIVGIRPAVAMTLIEMGVELDSVNTALTLDLALEKLEPLQS
jgi:rsbT antagonist protein RsbS